MLPRIIKLYLSFIPLLIMIAAFAIGGSIAYTIYLPIWFLHACLMLTALWQLGGRVMMRGDEMLQQQGWQALLLTLPWVFISVFFGMGPPPATIAQWVATATEQQTRYAILIACGVIVTAGFALLRESLKKAGEKFYSTLGFTAIIIALPLYIINMAFWGNFLTRSFRFFVLAPAAPRPEWYLVLKELFYTIAIVEVGLFYLATAAFAVSLKKAGWFKPGACRLYIAFSLLGFLLNCLPPTLPEPLGTMAYFVSIPAISFVMPYLMGLNLLQRKQVIV